MCDKGLECRNNLCLRIPGDEDDQCADDDECEGSLGCREGVCKRLKGFYEDCEYNEDCENGLACIGG